MTDRDHVPAELKRAVLVEAGHRCAIPRCAHPTTELAHIVPWSRTHEHTFANLIALCPNCHTRFDRGEIDRKAMLMYKRNLAILNNRYGEIERRMFRLLAESGDTTFVLGYGGDVMVANAVADGLFRDLKIDRGEHFYHEVKDADGRIIWHKNFPTVFSFGLTPKGLDFIRRYVEGDDIS